MRRTQAFRGPGLAALGASLLASFTKSLIVFYDHGGLLIVAADLNGTCLRLPICEHAYIHTYIDFAFHLYVRRGLKINKKNLKSTNKGFFINKCVLNWKWHMWDIHRVYRLSLYKKNIHEYQTNKTWYNLLFMNIFLNLI